MSIQTIWCLHNDCTYSSKIFKSQYGLSCHMKDIYNTYIPIQDIIGEFGVDIDSLTNDQNYLCGNPNTQWRKININHPDRKFKKN